MTDPTMSSKDVLRMYPVSYRQLDTWTTAGYLGEGGQQIGSGRSRSYTPEQLRLLERMLAFVAAGVKPSIAAAIARGDVEATRKLVEAMDMVK